jgi:DNA-binding transcriptional LysR family regulator
MSIDIRHIQAFLAVARELHYGRAASRLNVAQPALSRTVQHLEALLGVKLFDRTTRNVRLTDAGRTFQEQGSRVLHQLERAVDLTRRTPEGFSGSISIGYVDVLLSGPMPEIIQTYKSAHRGVHVQLSPHSPEELLDLLAEKQLDCGFTFGKINNDELDARCVSIEPAVALLPVEHRLTLKEQIRIADLSREVFILPPRFGWSQFHKMIEANCLEAGFNPVIGQETQQIEAMMALVAADGGVGICPESLCSALRSGVVAKTIAPSEIVYESYFVWHRDQVDSAFTNLVKIVSGYEVTT